MGNFTVLFSLRGPALIRANKVQLPRPDLDPRAETSASENWNRLLMGAVFA